MKFQEMHVINLSAYKPDTVIVNSNSKEQYDKVKLVRIGKKLFRQHF